MEKYSTSGCSPGPRVQKLAPHIRNTETKYNKFNSDPKFNWATSGPYGECRQTILTVPKQIYK